MISENIRLAMKNLDQFNLEVAQFRVEKGMVGGMPGLYKNMGRLNKELELLFSQARDVEELDKQVEADFNLIKTREER